MYWRKILEFSNKSCLRILIVASIVVLTGFIPKDYCRGSSRSWTEQFNLETSRFKSAGSTPYFILQPGFQAIFEDSAANTKLVITVTPKTRLIDGVLTRVVEEKEYEKGKLIEVSRNFFAIDSLTSSVFYFGESVDIYKNGKIVGHEGSWESGKGGARFGLMMPGLPLVGARYYQEIAPQTAMDRAEILTITKVDSVPAGRFTNCVETQETTPLEPGVKEYKTYAPRAGLIRDGDLRLIHYERSP